MIINQLEIKMTLGNTKITLGNVFRLCWDFRVVWDWVCLEFLRVWMAAGRSAGGVAAKRHILKGLGLARRPFPPLNLFCHR